MLRGAAVQAAKRLARNHARACTSSASASRNVAAATAQQLSSKQPSTAGDKPEQQGRDASEPARGKGPAKRNPLSALGMTLDDDGPLVQRSVIDALGPSTFTISGVRVSGSVLIMPDFSTLWNVDEMSHVTAPAFSIVKLSFPRPEIVLIGTGASAQPISHELRRHFAELAVNVEVLSTKNACQTFNVLNQEFRLVAAALLPHGYKPEQC